MISSVNRRRAWASPAVIARCLAALLLLTVLVSALVGVTTLSIGELWQGATQNSPSVHTILWEIRFPRIALALLVGASLAVAGAVSQAAFANPIAEPSIIGIGSGAALGLLIATALGATDIGSTGSVLTALVAALAISFLLLRVAGGNATSNSALAFLLSGIALAAALNALIGLVTSLSGRSDLRSISFWSLGSLSLATWSGVLAITPFVLAGIVTAFVISTKLDYLALGNARHLGISARAVRGYALVSISLLVAGGVAITGLIAFVGLAVPHVIRILIGPLHRNLILLSALGGALLTLIADTISRSLLQPIELPIGLLTALVGAPILLLSVRTLRGQS